MIIGRLMSDGHYVSFIPDGARTYRLCQDKNSPAGAGGGCEALISVNAAANNMSVRRPVTKTHRDRFGHCVDVTDPSRQSGPRQARALVPSRTPQCTVKEASSLMTTRRDRHQSRR